MSLVFSMMSIKLPLMKTQLSTPSSNSEMISEFIPKAILKKYWKFAIVSGIMTWSISISGLKTKKWGNLLPGSTKKRKYWLRREKKKSKINWRKKDKPWKKRNKNWKRYILDDSDEAKPEIVVDKGCKIQQFWWKRHSYAWVEERERWGEIKADQW